MVDQENLPLGWKGLFRPYLKYFFVGIVQNFQIVSSVKGLLGEFEVETFDEGGGKVGADHLDPVELIELFGLGAEVLYGIDFDCC